MALAALLGLVAVCYGTTLSMGMVERDLLELDTVIRTRLDVLLRGGALPGSFAPLSRELYWWWWGGLLQLGAPTMRVVNAAIAVGGGWFLFRAAEGWAGPRAATLAVLAWALFAPLGAMLGAIAGARELIAVLGVAAALAWFAQRRWNAAGVACGLAVLAGSETFALPIVLLVADRIERPADPLARRWRRILPALGASVAAAVLVGRAENAARLSPTGLATVAAFARAWVPEPTFEGVRALGRQVPAGLAIGLALLAVPRKKSGRGAMRLLPIGAAAGVLPLLPLALAPETLRAERFAVPAFGLSVAAGALAAANPWLTRLGFAALALIGVGANAAGPAAPSARFTSLATLRDQARATQPLLEALRPWCADLTSVPRTFATGVPADSLFHLAMGAGARVTCRDTGATVRYLAEMAPEDAAAPFGVLRLDARRARFQFERADARVRALVGEGLLLFARHSAAAACFEAAAAERPGDRELIYPRVIAMAAGGRAPEAHALWDEARRGGMVPSADSLAFRLLTGDPAPDAAAARREIAGLAAAVLEDPVAAAPHLALGRALLERDRVRSGTIEISVAWGIGRRGADLYWLARGYEAMGAASEALAAYRAALAGGLDSTVYDDARNRFARLYRTLGPSALGIPGP